MNDSSEHDMRYRLFVARIGYSRAFLFLINLASRLLALRCRLGIQE